MSKNKNWWQSVCLMIGEVFWFSPSRFIDLLWIPLRNIIGHFFAIFFLTGIFLISRISLVFLGLLGHLSYADGMEPTEEDMGSS
ncbi:MAG: hypothetical protein JJ979_25090 [Roseibium sp.]|nr:hypothetical protein [Roseibium sp.]